MKKFLYYPNLEPPDKEWLKFALLYMENFESIVPLRRQYLISEEYKLVEKETDLVSMYAPEYLQGYRATLKSIDESNEILNNEYSKSELFNKVNLKREWKNPENWKYQIYREKFSNEWVQYCESKGIGKKNEGGILLPRELAFIYMTHLSQEIAYERNGSIITDNYDYDNYTNYTRTIPTSSKLKDEYLRNIISLVIPSDISEIPFSQLIDFRNKNRKLISVFNSQVNKMEDSISKGITENQFIREFNSSYSELNKEIIQLGLGIATIPLAAYVLINNPEAMSAEYGKEIIGAMGIVTSGFFAVKGALQDQKEKRMSKRYMANLKRIK